MKTNLLVDKLIKQTEDKKLMNSMVYGFALFIVKSFAIYILWNFLATQNFFLGGITFSSALCLTLLVKLLFRR